MAQVRELMHVDSGRESAGVTDRLMVFERIVGEYETSSAELLVVQVKNAVLQESSVGTQDTSVAHLWFTSRLCHHETDHAKLLSSETPMAAKPANVEKHHWKSTPCTETETRRAHTGKKAKDKGKVKHKGKQELTPNFNGYCGHCGKWGHKQRD